MTTPTPAEVAALLAAAEKATPRPWSAVPAGIIAHGRWVYYDDSVGGASRTDIAETDKELIALACNLAQSLAAALAAERARLAEAERLLREMEWAGADAWDYDDWRGSCPSCRGFFPGGVNANYNPDNETIGHKPDCALAAFLKEGRP